MVPGICYSTPETLSMGTAYSCFPMPAIGFTWLKTDFLKEPCSCFHPSFLPSRLIAGISVLICFHESPLCLPSFPPWCCPLAIFPCLMHLIFFLSIMQCVNCQSYSEMPCHLTMMLLAVLEPLHLGFPNKLISKVLKTFNHLQFPTYTI